MNVEYIRSTSFLDNSFLLMNNDNRRMRYVTSNEKIFKEIGQTIFVQEKVSAISYLLFEFYFFSFMWK